MKHNFFLLCIIMAIASCNNATQSADKQTGDTGTQAPADKTAITPTPGITDSTAKADMANPASPVAMLVKASLQNLYKEDLEKGVIDSFSRAFTFSEYDLNEDGQKEILAGTRGGYFCGSGGCTMLLLDPTGKLISKFTVSDYPVVVSNNKTNGWKDLLIPSRGKMHVMKYKGKSYPGNPSTQPQYTGTSSDGDVRLLDKKTQEWISF